MGRVAEFKRWSDDKELQRNECDGRDGWMLQVLWIACLQGMGEVQAGQQRGSETLALAPSLLHGPPNFPRRLQLPACQDYGA